MSDDENRTSPTVKTITPVETHAEETTTFEGFGASWLSASKIEPDESKRQWKPGIPGYLATAPTPQEEVFRLRQQLSDELRRRLAAEQLVDALEDLIRLLDPHIQRRLQHKARVAVVAARAAWETTLREPLEVAGQGEREL